MTRGIFAGALLASAILTLSGCAKEENAIINSKDTRATQTPVSSDKQKASSVKNDKLQSELDQRMPELLETYEVPSAAVAYIADGRVLWQRNYGEQAPGKAATKDTLYNVASLTKPIVAETIMRLASNPQSGIKLDTPMASEYIDEDLKDEPLALLLTPKMMLSHRSGFAKNWRSDMPEGKLAISNEPGVKASYSGENPNYVAKYAEKVTGKSLEQLAKEQVFEPAGITQMWFTPSEQWKDRVAMVRDRDGELAMPEFSEQANAADDLHSTIGDYALFVLDAMQGAGLNDNIFNARERIYDDQVAQACPPGIIPEDQCPKHTGYGLGWLIYDSGDNRFLVHNGKDRGKRTIALFEPTKRYGVVIFTTGEKGRSVISETLKILVPDQKLNTLVAAEAKFDR